MNDLTHAELLKLVDSQAKEINDLRRRIAELEKFQDEIVKTLREQIRKF